MKSNSTTKELLLGFGKYPEQHICVDKIIGQKYLLAPLNYVTFALFSCLDGCCTLTDPTTELRVKH